MPVVHAKISGITDVADTTLVRPSDWNDSHVVMVDLATEVTGKLPTTDIDYPQIYVEASGGDDTASLNAFFAAWRAAVSLSVLANGAVIKAEMAPGLYIVTDTINATGIRAFNAVLECNGAVIWGKCAGKPVIDRLNSRFWTWNNLTIYGDATDVPTYGVQSGMISSANCGDSCLNNINIDGYFTKACYYTYSDETTTYHKPRWYNKSTVSGSYVLIMDGGNYQDITSVFVTQTNSVGTARSFNESLFLQPDFRKENGGRCIKMMGRTLRRPHFLNGYAVSADDALIEMNNVLTMADPVFDIHCETSGCTKYLLIDNVNPASDITIYGLQIKDHAPQASVCMIDVTGSTRGVNLTGCELDIGDPLTTIPLFGNTASNPSKIQASGIIKWPSTKTLDMSQAYFNGELITESSNPVTDSNGATPNTSAYKLTRLPSSAGNRKNNFIGSITAGNLSGTNTGDQTSIVGITGTKAQFDTACTDGNFLYVGDITQYTDEMAQDAVGAMVDTTLVYVDATPLFTRGAISGDISVPQASNTSTLVTVNSNVGSFGSATQVGTFTVNAKGLTTAAANVTITPAVGSITGFGTGVATALGVNNGTAGAFVVNGGVLGTPSSGTATNLTGIASGLTAGSVTNATFTTALTVNTGTVTLTGNAANTSVLTIGAGAVSISGANTGDQNITLTGAVTGSGTGSFATTIATPGTLTVSSTNSTATAHTHAITSSSAPGAAASILATDSSGIIGSTGTRIVKGWFTDLTVTNAISGSITGNASTVTTNANLTGPITSAGNATSIASQTGTGTKFVVDTSPTVITPTFTTSATTPLIIGGSGTTQTLTYKTTTGVGATGADHIFLVGNNGATEATRILNNASVGIGTSTPNTIDGLNLSTQRVLHVSSSGLTRLSVTSNGGASSDYIDSGAPANQKWFVLQNIAGVAYYRALDDAAGIAFQLMNFNLSNGNIKIAGTAARGITEGTNHLDIFDGIAPVGTLANGFSLYSVAGVPTVKDSSGNANGLGQASKPTYAGMIFTAPARLTNYTVATLPTGTRGDTAYVTDALAPGFLTIVVGGGTVVSPVFFNGTNWVAM